MAAVTTLDETRFAYLKPADVARLADAYRFSEAAHAGQKRQSGDPYISHPLAVADILASWRLDGQTLMAALLHDTLEDASVTKTEIAETFGKPVAELVDGVSKLDKIEFQSAEDAQAENFRKMLLAMARDVRVILIKLADRLHNMRTLDAVPPAKRRRIARETMEIYAPLAERIGIAVRQDDRVLGGARRDAGGVGQAERRDTGASRDEQVVGMTVRQGHGMNQANALAEELHPQFRGGVDKQVALRQTDDGCEFCTDQGNIILDCQFGPIADMEGLAHLLEARAGIIEHGLFLNLAQDVIVAGPGGIRHLRREL